MVIGVGTDVNIKDEFGRQIEGTESGLRIAPVSNQIIPLSKKRVSSTNVNTLPNIPCNAVVIVTRTTNTGTIWIGGSGSFPAAIDIGIPLEAGDTLTLTPKNSNLVSYIGTNDTDEFYTIVEGSSDSEPSLDNTVPPPQDLTAPTGQTQFPANGATSVATNTAIFATFDEAIDPATVTASTFTISPSVSVSVQRDSVDTTKIVMTPAANLANSTVYTITAVGGGSDPRIKDLAGNALAANYAWSFTTAAAAPPPDTTPPTISSKNPDSGATDVSISVTPQIVFSEQMLSSTINTTNIYVKKVSGGTTVSTAVNLQGDNKTVDVTLTGLEYSTQYRISVTTGVKDLAGNAKASLEEWTFTTTAPSYSIIYNVADTGNTFLLDGKGAATSRYGIIVKSNSATLYNQIINKGKLRMRRTSSDVTGTMHVDLYDSSNNFIAEYTADKTVSQVTTSSSSYTEVTFTNATVTTKMLVGYKWLFHLDNTGSGSGMRIFEEDPGATEGTNLKTYTNNDSFSSANERSQDLAAVLYTVD